MRIGLQDIDPVIAEAMLHRLAAQPNEFLRDNIHWNSMNPFTFSWEFHARGLQVKRKRDPTDDEKRAYILRKVREDQVGIRIAGTALVPITAAMAVAFGGMAAHLPAFLGGTLATFTWLSGTGAGTYWSLRATPKARLLQAARVEEMKAVFPLLTLTRGERIYCDTLLLLARMEVVPEAEDDLRETLRQLNTLVQSARLLEQQRVSLLPLLGNNVIPELEAEYGDLGRRLDRVTDAVTRQSLQQSLAMCQTRLENAKALEQGLERLKAQQEALTQTISTAQSALARLQIAPQLRPEAAAQEISETVAQMNRQTYAVEQAVQEVMTLRAQ